ncbi:ankyrin [Rhizoclosmatium globosum]|uniref:Ankyrin n=1 Tax=Rhizoclosmatium globosum TaxID=329046 RepID=A0A1Y2CZW5_9FUNG|nr:ankyrin [Rhizoclosmatium globosum]|eukprot:ORY52592.1 ankyrin [Rhizoclosmatium globosum]
MGFIHHRWDDTTFMNEQDDTAAPLESEAQAVNEGINEGSDGDGTSDDSWIVSEGVDDRVFCSAVVDSAHVDQATLWKEDRLWRSVVSGLLDELKDEAQTIRQGSLLPRAYERGAEGETILHIAVLLGHEELVEWILERFPDLVNEIYLKDTYCVENGNENVVKMLLKAGADVNAAPVTGAAFFNDQDKLQLYYGQTILQFAAANRQEGITQLLLDAGAHLDAVDFYGNNVLHVLAFLGNFDLNFFLKLKDRNLRDIDNKVLGAHGTVSELRGASKIIDCIKEIKWTFGDACEYEVTLEDIDSIQPVVPSSTKEPHINSTQHVSALEMAQQFHGYSVFLFLRLSLNDSLSRFFQYFPSFQLSKPRCFILKTFSGNIGPLVLIFRKVLFVDLREWLLLYAMFTAGFAAAFNLQMKDAHLNNSSILDWESYHGAVIWTVRFVFGGGNYDDFRESQFPVFTAGLFFLYGFLVLVLLVNIFIAKLSTTYEIISEDSTRLWKLQFASLMLDIDSRLSPEMQAKIASNLDGATLHLLENP